MKRKVEPKKLVLEQNTITVLTTNQFELVRGGGGGPIREQAIVGTRKC